MLAASTKVVTCVNVRRSIVLSRMLLKSVVEEERVGKREGWVGC